MVRDNKKQNLIQTAVQSEDPQIMDLGPLPFSHLFRNQIVVFATRHEKEKVLLPLFEKLGLQIKALAVDTDQFGTFTGEVNRSGTIRETLRKKIQEAARIDSQSRLFLASEGSFGPHPILGFGQSDLESLLLWDREENIEIYAEHLSLDVIHSEALISASDSPEDFLQSVLFPSHAVIVRPENSFQPVYKGVRDREFLKEAIAHCFSASASGKIVIATDLRAHQNPTRQKAIFRAGAQLGEKILSLCPKCHYPGFSISDVVKGLPCCECGEPSPAPKECIWSCLKCEHQETRPRPDGLQFITPDQCPLCNP